MKSPAVPGHLMVHRDGPPAAARVIIVLLVSMGYFAVVFSMIGFLDAGDPWAILGGVFAGSIVGVFPVGLIVSLLVVSVRLKTALRWCFGLPTVVCLVMAWYAYEPWYFLVWLSAFAAGTLVALARGPRYKTYRYGTCPGCKYDLTLLPKSDVCPECGRDNADLVERFADFGQPSNV